MLERIFWYALTASLQEYKARMHNGKAGTVSVNGLNSVFSAGLILFGLWAAIITPLAWGQQELNRRTKSKVVPAYPELAKRMSITGSVKILVTVSPNGSIKEAKLMGGHPLLANAALDAIKQWRFEPAPGETTGTVEFRFDPTR
jgi:protein TonB